MNKCDISEDETTSALYALYVTQIPAAGVSSGGPHTAHASVAASSTYNISGQLGQSRKRKNALKDENCYEHDQQAPAKMTLTSNQQAPAKNREVVDSEHYTNDRDPVSTHDLVPQSKSASERHKSKHKSRSSHSDGGSALFHVYCLYLADMYYLLIFFSKYCV